MHGRVKHLPKGIVNGKGMLVKPRSSLMYPSDFRWALVRSKYSAMMLPNISLTFSMMDVSVNQYESLNSNVMRAC
jgi:hypothetical protein